MSSEKDSSFDTILLALEAITSQDEKLLQEILQKFPLQVLDVERSDLLLSQLLNACKNYNRKELCRLIVSRWEETFPNQEMDFFSVLFKNTLLDEDTYAFLAHSFPEYSILSVVSDLCKDDSSDNLIRVMDNVFNAFGEQTPERLDVMRLEADSTGNFVIYNYITDKLLPQLEEAEIPYWVKNFRKTVPSTEELEEEANDILTKTLEEGKQIDPEKYSVETLIDYLTNGMAREGLSFENIEEGRLALRGLIPTLSKEELKELVGDNLVKGNLSLLQDNLDLFRILGPSNPQINAGSEDFLNGVDRMFTCSLYDYDDEDDEFFPWFTGNCLICLKRIRYYWHALRLARAEGGWTGCYCNFECAEKGLLNEEIPRTPDIAIFNLVKRNIVEKGIQDRTD